MYLYASLDEAKQTARRLRSTFRDTIHPLKLAEAQRIVALAGGWRDWHHLETTVGTPDAPPMRRLEEMRTRVTSIRHSMKQDFDEVIEIIADDRPEFSPAEDLPSWAAYVEQMTALLKARGMTLEGLATTQTVVSTDSEVLTRYRHWQPRWEMRAGPHEPVVDLDVGHSAPVALGTTAGEMDAAAYVGRACQSGDRSRIVAAITLVAALQARLDRGSSYGLATTDLDRLGGMAANVLAESEALLGQWGSGRRAWLPGSKMPDLEQDYDALAPKLADAIVTKFRRFRIVMPSKKIRMPGGEMVDLPPWSYDGKAWKGDAVDLLDEMIVASGRDPKSYRTGSAAVAMSAHRSYDGRTMKVQRGIRPGEAGEVELDVSIKLRDHQPTAAGHAMLEEFLHDLDAALAQEALALSRGMDAWNEHVRHLRVDPLVLRYMRSNGIRLRMTINERSAYELKVVAGTHFGPTPRVRAGQDGLQIDIGRFVLLDKWAGALVVRLHDDNDLHDEGEGYLIDVPRMPTSSVRNARTLGDVFPRLLDGSASDRAVSSIDVSENAYRYYTAARLRLSPNTVPFPVDMIDTPVTAMEPVRH